MRRGILVVFAALLIITMLAFYGCSKDDEDNNGNGGTNDTLSVSITHPANGDTVIGTLNIIAECGSTPDYVEFDLDTFDAAIDSTFPYSVLFDVSLYPSGNRTIMAIAYWGEITRSYVISIYIEHIECDSTQPVVINGDTIPEGRITRNAAGCVIGIDLSYRDISSQNCLTGIENYSASLETLDLGHNDLTSIDLSPLANCTNLTSLYLFYNQLTSIDLTPLSSCTNLGILYLWRNHLTNIDLSPLANCTILRELYLGSNDLTSIDLSPLANCTHLEWLELYDNDLTSIDLTPLSSCTNLWILYLGSNGLTSIDLTPLANCTNLEKLRLNYNQLTHIDLTPLENCTNLADLYLDGNDLDSASCAQVCQFADEHPNCDVGSDCDCGGKSIRISPKSERDKPRNIRNRQRDKRIIP